VVCEGLDIMKSIRPRSTFGVRHLIAVVATALGVTAVLNCGGAVTEAPACPSQLTGTCQVGEFCAEPTPNACGVTVSVGCHCDSTTTHWTCDAPAPCKPPTDTCGPNGVFPGDKCSVKGAACEEYIACAGGGNHGPGGGAPCTCDGNSWQCAFIECPPPPPNQCPAPGTLHGGEACFEQGAHPICLSGQPYKDCSGNVQGYADCECELGRWNCANIGMPFCPDGGPDASKDGGWKDGGGSDGGWSDGGWSDGGWKDSGKD